MLLHIASKYCIMPASCDFLYLWECATIGTSTTPPNTPPQTPPPTPAIATGKTVLLSNLVAVVKYVMPTHNSLPCSDMSHEAEHVALHHRNKSLQCIMIQSSLILIKDLTCWRNRTLQCVCENSDSLVTLACARPHWIFFYLRDSDVP